MESFQEALEKRVSDIKKIKFDKHTIEKATREVVVALFGNMGKERIAVADWNEGRLVLECEKSIWRTETILNKDKIIEQVNTKCGSSVVSDIRVRGE